MDVQSSGSNSVLDRALKVKFVEELMAEIRSPVEVGSLSHYLQDFIHPRWCRDSFINSSVQMIV